MENGGMSIFLPKITAFNVCNCGMIRLQIDWSDLTHIMIRIMFHIFRMEVYQDICDIYGRAMYVFVFILIVL